MKIILRNSIDKRKKVTHESFITEEQPIMYSGMHYGIIKNFIDAIEENREPMVNGREGLKSIKIITNIYKSAMQKKEIIFI